jgi:hypothetical protein
MLTPLNAAIFLLGAVVGSGIVLGSVALRLIEMRSRTGTLFYRVEAKLDLLLKQANIKFDPYANVPGEIADAVQAGQTLQAIKLYRDSTGVGLKEAKDFIEQYPRRVK